jgi:hypothetical protein
MPYHFELATDRPVLLDTMEPPFSGDLMADMAVETTAWLDRLDHPVYFIIDMGPLELALYDVMQGASAAARGANPPLHHPNIIETILITDKPLLKLVMKGLDSATFGFLNVKAYPTLDEAFAYVDAQVVALRQS